MPAHPNAMAASKPGRTRTAPPQTITGWYNQPRMRRYLLFDSTGVIYLLMGLLVLRAVWALGSGASDWQGILAGYENPIYVVFHLIALISVVFVGVRFFSLFPKAQPPQIGPIKPPPGPVIHGMLYAIWIGVTVVVVAILAGGLF